MPRHKESEQLPEFVSSSPAPMEFANIFVDRREDRSLPLRLVFRIIWHRRWIILAITLATVVVVLIRTVRQKPSYRAAGTMEIEMPRDTVSSIQDFFPTATVPDSYLQTQSKILNSDELAGQVMDQLHLASRPEFSKSASRWAQLQSFQQRLNVEQVKGSLLVKVSFEHQDPVLAARIVNKLMSIYIDQTQEDRFETASGASGWLMTQVKEAKSKLDESTDNLRNYERDHQIVVVNPDHERLMSIDTERLEQLQQEFTQVEDTRMEKEATFQRARTGDASILQSSLLDDSLKKEADLQSEMAELSKKFGPKFPRVQRLQEEIVMVQTEEAAERARLVSKLEGDYEAAVQRENLLRSALDEQSKKVGGGAEERTQDSALKREVDLNQQAYDGLLQKLQEATTATNLKTVNARIVDRAEPPPVSSHPGLLRNLFLSFFLGLAGGISLALAQDLFQDTFKSTGEIELDLSLPLLGVVPAERKLKLRPMQRGKGGVFHLSARGSKSHIKPGAGQWFRLDRDAMSHYEMSEAVRNLRTSLIFALDGQSHQSVLFSSSVPSEGKTTISSNISISLAQLGKRVLMIDGDLRRPCLHRVFSIPNRIGLSEYLQETCEWTSVVQPSGIPGLDVLVCGERPPNPAELLSAERMRAIISRAKELYDIVIIDSPTLLNMADSRILASYSDNVVLVVRSRSTAKVLAKQACSNVRSVDGTIIGVVLNYVEAADSDYSYSDYAYPKHIDPIKAEMEEEQEVVN